jgi:hypothetical protein
LDTRKRRFTAEEAGDRVEPSCEEEVDASKVAADRRCGFPGQRLHHRVIGQVGPAKACETWYTLGGIQKGVWRTPDSLPQAYQQLFGEPTQSEDKYYAYQEEGLPFYWSFVVAVDSETRTIQRYILWRAVALRPRENAPVIQP